MREEISFGDRLKSLRTAKGTYQGTEWTQKKVADKLGVSRGTYNGWENGVRLPSDSDLENIIRLFDMSQEDEEALYRAKNRMSPVIDTLPFLRNPLFTGREAQLEHLDQLLKESGKTQVVSINGIGGIGKTQLALEYAYRHYKKEYRAVFWVNAASETTIKAGYISVANRLQLPEHSVQDSNHAVEAVKRWLEGHTDWLLVLDNVDTLEFVLSFLPKEHRGHILLTTRLQFVSTIATKLDLEAMDYKEALYLLLRRSGLLKDNKKLYSVMQPDLYYAEELVKLLGGHPLAVDQAAAYMEETGVSPTDYLTLYREQWAYLLGRRGALDGEHPDAVTATLDISLQKACEWPSLAGDILNFCSFLNPAAIEEELLRHADGLEFDELLLNEAIASLQRYSLIKRNAEKKLLSMHRLTQQAVINSLSADLRKQWFLRIQWTLYKASKENVLGQRIALYNQQRLDGGKQIPLSSARFLSDHAESALKRADHLSENDHFSSSSTMAELFLAGEPVFTQEERKYAELKHQEAKLQEQLTETEHSPYHLELLANLCELGDVYGKLGNYDQAEALFERAASMYEDDLKHEVGAAVVAAYFKTLTTEHDQAEARERSHGLFKQMRKQPNARAAFNLFSNHMFMASVFYKWANLYQTRGKHTQAVDKYEQALTTLLKSSDRPNFFSVVINRAYAACLRDMGRDEEAAVIAARAESVLDSLHTEPVSWVDMMLLILACDADDTIQEELEDFD